MFWEFNEFYNSIPKCTFWEKIISWFIPNYLKGPKHNKQIMSTNNKSLHFAFHELQIY